MALLAALGLGPVLRDGPLPGRGFLVIVGVWLFCAIHLAKTLVRADWYTQGSTWDIEIDEVSAAELAASSTIATNGWVAPPWARSGWSRAALLLAPSVDDPRQQIRVRADLDRLESGAVEGAVERINLERDLVSEAMTENHA